MSQILTTACFQATTILSVTLIKVSALNFALTTEWIEMDTRFPSCDAVKIGAMVFLLGITPPLGSAVQCRADSMSPRKYNVLLALYKKLHPEASSVDEAFANPEKWAVEETPRLEPIVASILRGEDKDISWKYGLAIVAPLMPTPPICDAIYDRMDTMFSQKLATRASLDEREHGLLSSMLSVLAAGQDNRATPALNMLLPRDDYSYQTAREYILAIRLVGGETSLPALREMPLRKRNESIDGMAALAEKIIQARIEGKPFPPETAPEELRARTLAFIQAIERHDLNGLKSSLPSRVRELMDQERMSEFLDRIDPQESLPLIRAALDAKTPFEIDRDINIGQEYFQAKLVCGDRYVLEYIYDLDGWRVMNMKGIPVPRPDPGPTTYPENKGGPRSFIGKPAADEDNR